MGRPYALRATAILCKYRANPVHFGIIGAKLSYASDVLDVTNRYSFKFASDCCF